MLMPSSNKIIEEVLSRYAKYPLALTGCRTTERALECCEYDFVIIAEGTKKKGSDLLEVNGDYAEIHFISPNIDPFEIAPGLHGMRVINDPSWVLSSLKQQVDEAHPKALVLYSRKKAVDALLYANRAVEAAGEEDTVMPSLWLKFAAYYYLEATISRAGEIPMPTHMLAQLRSIENKTLAEGVALATSCLELERANRSSVSRSIEASAGLNEKLGGNYATQLVRRKASFLCDSGMYADCHLYLGYVARGAVAGIVADRKALRDYRFAISIAMDLTSDQSFALRLSRELLDACSELLKS
ncbi:MAG: hypothetical protein ACE5JV_03340 [Nitrososphaerales archaeon]